MSLLDAERVIAEAAIVKAGFPDAFLAHQFLGPGGIWSVFEFDSPYPDPDLPWVIVLESKPYFVNDPTHDYLVGLTEVPLNVGVSARTIPDREALSGDGEPVITEENRKSFVRARLHAGATDDDIAEARRNTWPDWRIDEAIDYGWADSTPWS